MASVALGPQSNRNPTNWARRGIIWAAVVGCIVGAYFAIQYYFTPAATLPKPEPTTGSVGKPYPQHKEKQAPAVATTASGMPRPTAEPTDRLRQTVKGDPAPKDDIMDASADFPNHGGGPMVQRRPAPAKAATGPDGELVSGADDQFAAKFQASRFPTAHAYVDKHSFYKISAGRKVHCHTSTWINSQHAGEFTCEISETVMNDKGSLPLLPKGSHAIGQLRTGLVQGQNRLMAIFSSLRTDDEPEIKVMINSPAADALGAAGIPVTVNDFFWENLLATSVYAILDTLPLIAANALNSQQSNNNSVTNFTQITQPEANLAGRMLNERLKRAPIGERGLGADLVIFFNQDVDFYDAVEVRMRRAGR